MDEDIKKTINQSVEELKIYQSLQKDKAARKQTIVALVKAITDATTMLIEKEWISKTFLFGEEGLYELSLKENGKAEKPDSYIIEYENFMHISELEIGYIIEELKKFYPLSNYRFGYHYYGYSLKISINI